ncbi:MAG: bifunctional riboflavin kinase/FAD synthetase [Bacteroidaceae bacterium]|nr:bifunctional riboflavin kinase/FAD synthetase [Bacteroides sp.]MBO5000934.1 bifunctional riboflavin kinase/FAD synthetase [Bacteroidaceae bacterium]
MNVIEDIHPQSPTVATIGFFDGVHLGHRFLIQQVKVAATQTGWQSSIITFPVHPRQVIQSEFQPQLLSSPEEKIELLASTGVDNCILLPFTRELSQLTAYEFMQLLYDKYKVRMLVIGYDHRFGHNRAETFEDYCRYGRELGIHIMQASAYTQEQDKVSSSAIRRALQTGDIRTATKFLGYHYYLEGTVVDGYKVGRKIGFPTANLRVDFPNKLIPSIGVYAVCVYVNGGKYKGMLNIGYRPTINNGTDLSIEVHILDFQGDIYHQKMRIEFIDFLRPEEKFNSVDELILQMQKDKEDTIRVLK